jgi:hypothetical protein
VLFLDTCSVVKMMEREPRADRPFTWTRLLRRAQGDRATFGAAGISDAAERVYLIFTNTVIRELDNQSQQRGACVRV